MLSSADVFVLPSYAEGFPMSLIEALSKGLPAICTDVGGISDSLRDGVNGYLIPSRQVPPLVDAMERYLMNPQIIAEHSRASLEIVRANHRAEANCELVFKALR
jgi:glycosyltransferase involved in cell wall biosynthesis